MRRTDRTIFRACCLLLLFAALVACRLGGDNTTNNRRESSSSSSSSGNKANSELCRKYESCGCANYDKCMEQLANSRDVEKPGVRECMLSSSCQSLCAGKPDACMGTGQGSGSGTGSGGRSNCSAIPCSNNSDCPSDCYGGCDGVRCYSF